MPLSGQRSESGSWKLHNDYKTERQRNSGRRTCCRRKFRSCPGTIELDWPLVKGGRQYGRQEAQKKKQANSPGAHHVAQRKLQPTKFRMVIHAKRVGDIQAVTGQQL